MVSICLATCSWAASSLDLKSSISASLSFLGTDFCIVCTWNVRVYNYNINIIIIGASEASPLVSHTWSGWYMYVVEYAGHVINLPQDVVSFAQHLSAELDASLAPRRLRHPSYYSYYNRSIHHTWCSKWCISSWCFLSLRISSWRLPICL